MKAAVGDQIVIASSLPEQPARQGRIVEVRNADGSPPYLVEWSDNGHRELLIPGPDAHLRHPAADGSPATGSTQAASATTDRTRTWRVDVSIVEHDRKTTAAHAVLVGEVPRLAGHGTAHRNPTDFDVPEIGDEVAVARALRRLADHLLANAAVDISEIEGVPVRLRP